MRLMLTPVFLSTALLAAISLPVIGADCVPERTPTRAAFERMREHVLHPPPGEVVVVAHRACHSVAPENTPDAIEACWQLGVPVVENDVRRTRDGVLVVFHDADLKRMTDREGKVAEMTLAQLREARLRERTGGADAFVTNTRITTLEEYLDAIRYKVLVNFEIKAEGEEFREIFAQSVVMARQKGVLDHLLFKIPDIVHHGTRGTELPLARLNAPKDVMLMPIIWESGMPLHERLDEVEPYGGIGYEMPVKHADYLAQVRTQTRLAGRPVMALALWPDISAGLGDAQAMRDPDANWGRMRELGANWIMTDRPEALLRYLRHTPEQ